MVYGCEYSARESFLCRTNTQTRKRHGWVKVAAKWKFGVGFLCLARLLDQDHWKSWKICSLSILLQKKEKSILDMCCLKKLACNI